MLLELPWIDLAALAQLTPLVSNVSGRWVNMNFMVLLGAGASLTNFCYGSAECFYIVSCLKKYRD